MKGTNLCAQNEANDSAFSFDPEVLRRSIQANVIGPALLAQVYLPLLDKGRKKTIVNVTSGLASIGLNIGDKNATYSISKIALNMLVCWRYSLWGGDRTLSTAHLRTPPQDVQAEGRTFGHHGDCY